MKSLIKPEELKELLNEFNNEDYPIIRLCEEITVKVSEKLGICPHQYGMFIHNEENRIEHFKCAECKQEIPLEDVLESSKRV